MPTCRRCGAHFSSNARIDGVRKNLHRRKLCLKCSPWGLHNTRPLGPLDESGKQRYIRKLTYHRRYMKDYQKRQRNELRRQVLARFNNRCADCGIDDPRVLEIHHINNNGNRDHAGGSISMYRAFLRGEIDDIIIVCANCHRIRTNSGDFGKLAYTFPREGLTD